MLEMEAIIKSLEIIRKPNKKNELNLGIKNI